jgi:hypothetical protein
MTIKERPILFNAQMVRATLSDQKTQTRRAMKYQVCDPGKFQIARPGYCEIVTFEGARIPGWNCPYGKPGDRLWVRETFCWSGYAMDPDELLYRADQEYTLEERGDLSWKPSIFMPRWASRITLEITNVRVERLQDITRGDCMSEGCPFPNLNMATTKTDPIAWFSNLWCSINGTGSWQANPWVWVIEFKRVEQ